MTASPGRDFDPQIVELKVPALGAYVSVLRTTSAALAARLDFTLDEIEDLRIGVDEASALLLAQASAGSALTCRFALNGDELTTSVSATSDKPQVPPEDSFAWTVLTALAGPAKATIDHAASRVTLTLSKRAEAVRRPDAGDRATVSRLDTASSTTSRSQAPAADPLESPTAEQ